MTYVSQTIQELPSEWSLSYYPDDDKFTTLILKGHAKGCEVEILESKCVVLVHRKVYVYAEPLLRSILPDWDTIRVHQMILIQKTL